MALRLTSPGKDLVSRRARPVKGIRASKYDWASARRDYVEGIPNDPNDPLDFSWPTLAVVAEKYSIPPNTVAARSSREHWGAQKRSIMLKVDVKRRAARERMMAKEGIAFDTSMLTIAKLGTHVVQRRLAEIVKDSNQRDQMKEHFIAAMERGEVPDVSVMEGMADFDSKEVVDLASAAQRFQEIGNRVIGIREDAVAVQPDEDAEQHSITQQLHAGTDDRLIDLLDALRATGVLAPLMGELVQGELEEGDSADTDSTDNPNVIDAEIVEAVVPQEQSRFSAGMAQAGTVNGSTNGAAQTSLDNW